MSILKTLPALILLLCGAPCHASVIPHLSNASPYALGTGFDAQTRLFKQSCVHGVGVNVADGSGEVYFNRNFSEEDMRSYVEATFEGGMNLGIASGSVKTKLTSTLNKSSYSDKVYYRSTIRKSTFLLNEPVLTALGERLLREKDPELTRANCGDEYVDYAKHGGDLFIEVTYRFNEEAIRNEFLTKVKIKIAGATKTKTFTKVREDIDQATFIDIDAFQVGGDPTELDRVLTSINQKSCRLDNVEECNRIIDRLIDYATSEEEFLKQVNESDSVISYHTRPYFGSAQEKLYPVSNPVLEGAAKSAANEIAESIGEMESIGIEVEHQLTRPMRDSERSHFLYLKRTTIPNNLSRLRNAASRCFKAPLGCTATRDEVMASIVAIPRESLDIRRTFFHYCKQFESDPQSLPGLNLVLLKTNFTDCSDAEDYLAGLSELDLSHMGIVNAFFLRGLDNLRVLNLSGNRLGSVGFASAVPNLQKLDISNNEIDEIGPLRSLTQLNVLRMQNNKVTNIAALEHMTALKSLIAYNNNFADLTPLKDLPLTETLIMIDDACEDQRQWALQQGLTRASENEGYAEIDFVPLPYDGGHEWVACSAAIGWLHHSSDKL